MEIQVSFTVVAVTVLYQQLAGIKNNVSEYWPESALCCKKIATGGVGS